MSQNDPRAQIVSLLPRLRRFAGGLTPDRHLADDLVQAACLKALERWHQWTPGTSLASWMFRIVQNTWLDDFRAKARHATDHDEDALLALAGDDGQALLEQRSELRAVRERALLREHRRWLEADPRIETVNWAGLPSHRHHARVLAPGPGQKSRHRRQHYMKIQVCLPQANSS